MRINRAGQMALGMLGLAFLGTLAYLFLYLLDPYRLKTADWRLFKKRFVTDVGRVVDTGNGNISHSEGQGYALLFAVAYRDRAVFDRIWTWTRRNLQTRPNDKLLSWRWEPGEKEGGRVTDPNNASDGDVLVAWALLRASELWQEPRYLQDAAQILDDLSRLDVISTDQGLALLPGTDGFLKGAQATLNPSYYVFPAFDDFARVFPAGPWKELKVNGLGLLRKARFGEWSLTPDWVVAGLKINISPDFPPVFGYNAIRVPLYLGWSNPKSKSMQPFARFWRKFGANKPIPATVNLLDNTFGPDPMLSGMDLVARFAISCTEKQSLTLSTLPVLTEDEPYYSASLNLLTKIAIQDAFSRN
jgi:endoglucanase